MECIEARALKSSFLSGLAMKSTQQALFDDLWCVAGINNVVVNDDFSVDDLLDLSDKDFSNSGGGGGSFEEYSEEDEEKDFLSVSSQDNDNNSLNSSKFSSSGDLASLPAGELPVPVDDMENLEWLSQIVDDSGSELSFLCPAANLKEKAGEFAVNRFEPVVRTTVQCFTVLGLPYQVPRKFRTKRSRKPTRVWSAGSLSLTDSSSTTSSSFDSSVTSPMLFSNPVQYTESFLGFGKPPAKKHKKTPVSDNSSGTNGSLAQRRCTHCQVQKTPQWRTGPLGPKTLCNACGVRFKSGRLFPEYRPACSPTFSGDLHSNSHRKVLEMRKMKEMEVVEPGLNSSVQSF